MRQTSIMFLSRSISPLSLSGLLLILSLRLLDQPVNAISNSSTLNHALDINCRGSGLCPSRHLSSNPISTMLSIANGRTIPPPNSNFNYGPLNNTSIYKPTAHIICLPLGKSFLGSLCAFTQGNVNSIGTSGAVIKRKLQQLSDHGCQICGSVPLGDGNDPAEAGILTVNYVSGVACPGLCPPTHYDGDSLVEML